MAAEVHKAFGIECTLIPKSRGIFDVCVDGVVVYSKYETGSYPEPSDIVATIRDINRHSG